MYKRSILLVFLFFLLLVGCSSTPQSQFKSPEDLFMLQANEAIENNFNIKYRVDLPDMTIMQYEEPSEYNIAGNKATYQPIIYLRKDENSKPNDLQLQLEIIVSGKEYNVTKVNINEVTFNSTQIECYNAFTEGTAVLLNVDSYQSPLNTEEKFLECLESINQNDDVTISLTSGATLKLTEYDIEQLRGYFDIYNTLRTQIKF